jgi:WD40 repeat protein
VSLLEGLAFAPDGRLLAVINWSSMRVWDPASGKLLREFLGHRGYVENAAWSPDGRWIASVGRDKVVLIWDATTYAPVAALRGMNPCGFAFAPDGATVAISDRNQGIVVWRVADATPVARLTSDAWRCDVAWSGNTSIAGTDTGLEWIAF